VKVANERCEEIGRDPATLETSMLVTVMIDENATPDVIPDEMKQGMVVGSAERVAEQIKIKVLDAGIDGVIVNMPTNMQGYEPGLITAAGEALRPLVRR
jgi:alkanesulfonate monooxygenase SsuD/methylene tetrahydromethanopterin reductase-like flavin-dependent oxidoreductase (luciferase family)